MKIKEIIVNDIVENISLYKSIRDSWISIVKEVYPDYVTIFTFDDFYSKLIENFDGIEDDIVLYVNNKGNVLTNKLLDSLIKITMEEFGGDDSKIKDLYDIVLK